MKIIAVFATGCSENHSKVFSLRQPVGTRNKFRGQARPVVLLSGNLNPKSVSLLCTSWRWNSPPSCKKHGEQDEKVGGERLLLMFHYSRILSSTTEKNQLHPHLPVWKQILQLLLFAKCDVCDTAQDWDEGTDVSKQNEQKLTEMAWSEWKVPFSPSLWSLLLWSGFFKGYLCEIQGLRYWRKLVINLLWIPQAEPLMQQPFEPKWVYIYFNRFCDSWSLL